MTYGPNVSKLLTKFIAREAVPVGGGFQDGIKFLTDQEHRKKVLQKAEEMMLLSIKAIKSAPDNPFGTDDEKIAEEILKRIAEKDGK
jgi:hypothetical protein